MATGTSSQFPAPISVLAQSPTRAGLDNQVKLPLLPSLPLHCCVRPEIGKAATNCQENAGRRVSTEAEHNEHESEHSGFTEKSLNPGHKDALPCSTRVVLSVPSFSLKTSACKEKKANVLGRVMPAGGGNFRGVGMARQELAVLQWWEPLRCSRSCRSPAELLWFHLLCWAGSSFSSCQRHQECVVLPSQPARPELVWLPGKEIVPLQGAEAACALPADKGSGSSPPVP